MTTTTSSSSTTTTSTTSTTSTTTTPLRSYEGLGNATVRPDCAGTSVYCNETLAGPNAAGVTATGLWPTRASTPDFVSIACGRTYSVQQVSLLHIEGHPAVEGQPSKFKVLSVLACSGSDSTLAVTD